MSRQIGTICLVLLVMVAVTFANDETEDTRQKRQFDGAFGLLNGFLHGYGYGRYPYYGYQHGYGVHRPVYGPYHYYGHRWSGYGW